MPAIQFETKLFRIKSWTILLLPKEASAKLPSRGQAMVEGTINGIPFTSPLEPDGNWSHWLKIDAAMGQKIGAQAGDAVKVSLAPVKVWPEPQIPADLQAALDTHKEAYATWAKATPMAHWEWMRWIRSTNKQETHARRLEVACSKLTAGERRPCCWNRNLSTEPLVSKNGILLVPNPQD
jgi:Domain of unknown function (DUF1905)/Bacteriocin-protection, YdeI or OmpD-Associated